MFFVCMWFSFLSGCSSELQTKFSTVPRNWAVHPAYGMHGTDQHVYGMHGSDQHTYGMHGTDQHVYGMHVNALHPASLSGVSLAKLGHASPRRPTNHILVPDKNSITYTRCS